MEGTMEVTQYEAPANDVSKQILALVDGGKAIVIKDADSDAIACEFAKKLKTQMKILKDTKESITKPLNESLKRIRAIFAPAEEAAEKLERGLKDAHNAYVFEQQRIAKQREAELAEKARKEAEELAEQAKDAAFAGNVDVAQDLEQQAEQTRSITPTVPVNTPKVEKVAMKTYWSAEIVDPNLVPREFMIIDTAKLNALARATKGPSNIPGVKFVSRKDVAFGSM